MKYPDRLHERCGTQEDDQRKASSAGNSMNQDFETHPLGTGQELARLNDLVQELGTALKAVLPYAEEPLQAALYRNHDEESGLVIEQTLNDALSALQKAGL